MTSNGTPSRSSYPDFPSRTKIQAAIDRATSSTDGFELIHALEKTWPLGSQAPSSSSKTTSRPHIVVMDSSFNPPHFAHLAMASSTLPERFPYSDAQESRLTEHSDDIPYTARLLLFSVRNIEKTPKPGDASAVQRIEMTLRLASHLASTAPIAGGVAVGLLNEPTFVGKSRIIHTFLADRLASLGCTDIKPKLSFLIGTDTLTRFFVPRFYPNGMDKAMHQLFKEDETILICARRGESEENRETERAELERLDVRPWVEKGSLRMLGSGKEGWEEVSSTRIRKAVTSGDVAELESLVPREIVEYIQEEGLYRE